VSIKCETRCNKCNECCSEW